MVQKVVTYVAFDGKEFDNENAANEHEIAVNRKIIKAMEKFWEKHGKALAKEGYTPDTEGVFEVFMAGDIDGRAPRFCFARGKLNNIVRYAVAQDNWAGYGEGGKVVPLNIKDIGDE